MRIDVPGCRPSGWPTPARRGTILTLATLVVLLVGLSRIVLGVHWATDVAAGWAFGAAWALAWLLLERRLSKAPSANTGGHRAVDR